MLSETEIEFLKNPQSFDANYSKALRHRIRAKIEGLREELRLLENAGFMVTEKCNQVTENYNPKQSLNQVAFQEQGLEKVRSPGFEPGIISLEG